MRRLIEASRGERFAEARLCGFAYAPRRAVPSPDVGHSSANNRSRIAAGLLLTTLTDRDPDARHARAVSWLIRGHAGTASRELDELTRGGLDDARVWADLAAARYELARTEDDARGFADALAAAATAIELDPVLPEARFNYALAAEALSLHSAAAESFRWHLTIEPGSAWSDEARQRLSAVQTPTSAEEWTKARPRLESMHDTAVIAEMVRRCPQQARSWTEGEYLARWAEAHEKHDHSVAEHWLTLSRGIGNALAAQSGEALLRDHIAAIDRATSDALTHLAKAHLSYRYGRMASAKGDHATALPALGDAEKEFGAAQSPMALMARLFRGAALIGRQENAEAAVALAPLLNAPETYFALRGYAAYHQSLILGNSGHLFEALDTGQSGQAMFERIGEIENESRALTSMAGTCTLLGRPATAWQLHRRAFALASASGSPLTLDHALRAAGRAELRENHQATARALFDIELRLPTSSPRLRVDALVQRLKANSENGDLRAIRSVAALIPDARVRQEAMDDIDVAEARRRQPAQAVAVLTRSIAFRKRIGDDLALAGLHLDRARAFRSLKRNADAEFDLLAAMAAVEAQRSMILSGDMRDTFTDTWRDIVEELFDLYIGTSRYQAAFDLIERTRARGLLERFRTHGPQYESSSPSTALAARVPPRTVIAQFTRRGDAMVILTLTHQGLTAHVRHGERFQEKAAQLNDAIQHSRGEETNALSEEIRNVLIAPMAPELRRAETLVVIPDDDVAAIPFAALRDRSTGRFLVEDLSIAMAPSASSYLSAIAAQRSPAMRALLAGDPAIDTQRFPDLPPLPSAGREVKAMGSLYSDVTVLTRDRVTRLAVLRKIATSDVVHIAAHAVVNERDSSLSVIPLAPASEDSGILSLRDIAALHLERAPVVVLAGCRTASRAAGYGSLRSLAAAFLAAGSRATVGALWDVEDGSTRAFSTQLHRALARGTSTLGALRNAQISMLNSADPELRAPAAWAGFQVYIAQ